MSIALARRYRPRRFADLLVQDHVAAVLRGAVAKGRVGHGYLLTGPRGVGKTTAARILAMFGGGALLAAGAASAGVALGTISALPPPQAGWIGVGLALSLGFLVSNVALQYGAARMNAHAAALVMLSEVVFASLSSVALGAAELTARTLSGGALILAAAVWSAWPVEQTAARRVDAQ